MKAEDWLEMPERMNMKQIVTLSEKEMKVYKDFEKESYIQFMEGEVTALTAGALTQKLLQYANGAMYHNEDMEYIDTSGAKLDALDEIVELSNGKPVLVFYSFKHDLERIKARFGKRAVKLETSKDIEKWNKAQITMLYFKHMKQMAKNLKDEDFYDYYRWAQYHFNQRFHLSLC